MSVIQNNIYNTAAQNEINVQEVQTKENAIVIDHCQKLEQNMKESRNSEMCEENGNWQNLDRVK